MWTKGLICVKDYAVSKISGFVWRPRLHESGYAETAYLIFPSSHNSLQVVSFVQHNTRSIRKYIIVKVSAEEIKTNIFRRQISHSFSHMPRELHQLLWRQTCLRLNIRVLKICIVQPTAPSKVPQEITIRDIFNDNKYRICEERPYNDIRNYKLKFIYIRLAPSRVLNLFISPGHNHYWILMTSSKMASGPGFVFYYSYLSLSGFSPQLYSLKICEIKGKEWLNTTSKCMWVTASAVIGRRNSVEKFADWGVTSLTLMFSGMLHFFQFCFGSYKKFLKN